MRRLSSCCFISKVKQRCERVSVPLEIYQDFKLPVRLLCYCKIHYCGRPHSLACELPSRCGTLPFVRSQRPLTPSTRLLVFVPPAETPHLSMPGWANLLTGGATLGSTMREALEQQQVDGWSVFGEPPHSQFTFNRQFPRLSKVNQSVPTTSVSLKPRAI